MRKIILLAFGLILGISINANAQLSGVLNIPGSYATLELAITDLNTQGVAAGGVTLNLLAGNPQTAPLGGYVIGGAGSLVLTSTSSTAQVIIQGNGNTITASSSHTVGAINDAIFKIIGADWITIQQFTMQENPLNIVNTPAANNTMTEFGVALFYVTATDGCQNIKILNNTISLNRVYTNTFGIYSNSTHTSTAMTTSASATGPDGGNHNLVITGNNVSNVNQGIVVIGPTAATDQNTGMVIGGSLANANTISNFGTAAQLSSFANVSGTMNGVLVRNSIGYSITHNSISSSVGGVTVGTLRGIFNPLNSATSIGTFTNNINNNTISMESGVATGVVQGINLEGSTASVTSTLNINNNNFTTLNHTVASSGAITGIINVGPHQHCSISGNTFTNLVTNTTGSFTFISNNYTAPVDGTKTINNNSIVTGFNKTGAGGTISLYTDAGSSTTGTSIQNNNNNFSNITVTGATTITGWFNNDGTLGTPQKTMTGNTFENWIGGTSPITVFQTNFGNLVSMTGNTINNISGNGAITGLLVGGSGTYNVAANVSTNTITNLSTTGTGGAVTGLSFGAGIPTSGTHSVSNNSINTLSSSSTTATVVGLTSGSSGSNISNNTIHTLTCVASTSGATNGIMTTAGVNVNVFGNKIYNIQSTGAFTTMPGVNGIVCSGATASTTVNVFNNLIGDLKAVNANSNDAIRGLSVTATGTLSNYNFSYNSVHIDASSSGINFGTTGIFHTASTTPTTASLTLRNNIIYNNSTANGTGLTVAYRRNVGTANMLSNYNSASNNNLFYAGTPSATNVIYFDGTSTGQTINNYKSGVYTAGTVAPRDAQSFTENPTFVSVIGGSVNFLKISIAIPTQIESGGITVVGITNDFSGTPRYPNIGYPEKPGFPPTAPDVGAHEFGGEPLDLAPPIISFVPLGNTGSLGVRTLIASITDASGVPIAGIGLPVLYWSINNITGPFAPATGSHVSGSNYQFNFGSGVSVSDVVYYYIVAQDLAPTPNIGANPSLGAAGYSTNPPAVSTPPTTPASYLVTSPPLSGDYTVGSTFFRNITGKNIYFEKTVTKVMKELEVTINDELDNTGSNKNLNQVENSISHNTVKQLVEVEEISWTPMLDGQVYTEPLYVKKAENPEYIFPDGIDGIYLTLTAAINDLNLRGVSGATRFLLTDSDYSAGETFPITVNIASSDLPTSTNTVTIKPNSTVDAIITGSAASNPLIHIRNSYISIDGSNTIAGTTRNLTIENTSVTSPQVLRIGSTGTTPIVGSGLRNSIAINGVTSSSAITVLGADGNAGYFNNVTIQNNDIRKAFVGVFCNAVVSAGNGSGSLITGNTLNSTGANAIRQVGIYLQGVDGATVTNNTLANFNGVSNEIDRGIWFATGTRNSTISRNLIHSLNYTGTGGYGGQGIYISTGVTGANIRIDNNVIYDLSGDGWSYLTIPTDNTYGILLGTTQTGINIYYNSIHLFGNTLNQANAISAGIGVLTGSVADIRNNVIVNNLGRLGATGHGAVGVFAQTNSLQFANINFNDYLVDPTGTGVKAVGQISITPHNTLAEWQTATGQDANSISADPLFQSATDLRPSVGSPLLGAGTPIVGITTDILGDTRSLTTPTIGAYEDGVPLPSIDVGITSISSPSNGQIINKNGKTVTAYLTNLGTVVVNNVDVFIQFMAESPIGPVVVPGPLNPGDSALVTFSGANQFTTASNNTGNLSVYSVYPGDGNPGNDGTTITVSAVAPVTAFPFFETWSSPAGWSLSGAASLWSIQNAVNPSGTAGDPVYRANFYDVTTGSQLLRSPIIDLSGMSNPMLAFYVAYATYNAPPANDVIQVLVSTNSGVTYEPAVYNKGWSSVPSLATVAPFGLPFLPGAANQWRHEIVDLSAYAGQEVIVSFNAITAWGNNAWIDNVKIADVNNISLIPVNAPGLYGNLATNGVQVNFTALRPGLGNGMIQLDGQNTELAFPMENLRAWHDVVETNESTIQDKSQVRRSDMGISPDASEGVLALTRVDEFPINNNYAANASATTFSGAIFTPDVVSNRYWEIAFSGNDYVSTATYDIIIDISTQPGIVDPDRLYIMRRVDQNSDWVCISTITEYELGLPVRLIATGLTGFSQFGIGTDDGTLPVDLVEFNATVDRNNITLNWTTAWEENNMRFDVQRRPVIEESATWQTVGSVAGNGTTQEQKSYSYLDRNLITGKYEYRLVQVDFDGNSTADHTLSSQVEVGIPTEFTLSQNYPNPFNPTTKIDFQIPVEGLVKLSVYDMSGREVATLVNEALTPGYYTYTFNGANFASGVYFYRLVSSNSVITKRAVLVK